ncbi:MAG: pyridoxamine 5'-phosphate oxidase family protein [Pseudomonadales bacterium]
MKGWTDLENENPDLAESGRAMFYQFKVGLGYLATIRKDGGPRVHPVCPIIAAGGLFVFIGNHSPKLHDLLRDGRYALHAFPKPEIDDEFYVSGVAMPQRNGRIRDIVYATYTATGAFTEDDTLFELFLERVLHAKYASRPSWPPSYTKWHFTGDV